MVQFFSYAVSNSATHEIVYAAMSPKKYLPLSLSNQYFEVFLMSTVCCMSCSHHHPCFNYTNNITM